MYGEHSRSTGPPLYPHNTYHGYNHHQRTPLAQANFKPLKFTDSPMNNYNSTGHNSIVDGENVSQDDEVCTQLPSMVRYPKEIGIYKVKTREVIRRYAIQMRTSNKYKPSLLT